MCIRDSNNRLFVDYFLGFFPTRCAALATVSQGLMWLRSHLITFNTGNVIELFFLYLLAVSHRKSKYPTLVLTFPETIDKLNPQYKR